MRYRPVWAEVNLGAIRRNFAAIQSVTQVPALAVVKADAYGHGAAPVSRAALDAGATGLAVALRALFDETVGDLRQPGIAPGPVHAATSAGALAVPASRYDLVRIGISLYGVLPTPCFRPDPGLEPVMSLKAKVSYVRTLDV